MAAKFKPLAWIREGECIRCISHALSKDGYPKAGGRGKRHHIARLILIRRLGNIPSSVVSRHTCDNRWCIRPDHIISGTHAQNMRDRKERGKYVDQHGSNNRHSKLTSLQVCQIRESIGSQKEISERFGITQPTVSRILNRKGWNHI